MSIIDELSMHKKFKTFENEKDYYSLEIPATWKVVSITDDYGHSFSDENRKEGMLSIKPVIAPSSSLEEYCEALLESVKEELKYKFFASTDTFVAKHLAKEIVFIAPAFVNGHKKKAVMTVLVIEDLESYRFLVMTFTTLESEYEKNITVYKHAKKTFMIL